MRSWAYAHRDDPDARGLTMNPASAADTDPSERSLEAARREGRSACRVAGALEHDDAAQQLQQLEPAAVGRAVYPNAPG